MNAELVKLLLLGRLVAFMLLFYLGFGLLVEWRSVREGSKLKAFARLLCRPLTAPVALFARPETAYRTLLWRSAVAVLVVWLLFVLASEAALSPA